MKLLKTIAYVISAIVILSSFLPWLTASSSVELSGMVSGGQSYSQSTTGILTSQGIIGLLLALVTIFMIYKDYKWSFAPGAINVLNGVSLLFLSSGKEINGSSTVNSGFGSQSASISGGLYPAIGLYIFFACSILLLIVLLIKEFKPDLLSGSVSSDGSVTSLDTEQLKGLLTNEYVMAGGILVFMFWLNQKVGSSLNGFSDLLLALVFFVAIPYFLAKKAEFKLVQNLILSFTLAYVLLALLAFLNISTYRYAIVGVAKSFFAITLLALVYEFVARKKADAIPLKVHAIIEKLDLKKISIILVVIVALACAKEFVSTSMAQSSQQETTQVSGDTATIESNTTTEVQPQVQEQAPIETTPEVEAAAPAVPRGDYSINDPDGYTNLRATPGGKIIRKVYENETFDIIESAEPYSKIKLTDGTVGYLHTTRISPAN
jgi:hypothetical protein